MERAVRDRNPVRWTAVAMMLGLAGCAAGPSTSLLERSDQPQERSRIELTGEIRDALAPPFPSVRRFEVDIPSSPFFRFAPALITEQPVRRARVAFRVLVEGKGAPVVVFDEVFRFSDANRWHGREVDLSAWAGQRVVLTLVTRTPEERANILWADRLQAVWGAPSLTSSPKRALATASDELTKQVETWLLEHQGVTPDELGRSAGIVVNLFLAVLLALVIRALYLRCALERPSRDTFGNLFPLFTLTTVLVIVVVESSLALSLGLIGALSIVRFRTAIKTPEEIAYLLFCIGTGVALGARERSLALVATAVICLFVLARRAFFTREGDRTLLLTVSGDADRFYHENALERVRPVVGNFLVERLEQHGDRVELRARVTVAGGRGMRRLAADLHAQLPSFQFSFAEADDLP